MRYLLFLLLPALAFAHPADDLCPAGTEPFGCQPAEPHLHLDDPDFYICHRAYWHERRKLEAKVRAYTACLESIWTAERLWFGLTAKVYGVKHPTVLQYWDVIPAHPIADRPGNIDWCRQSFDTAVFGNTVFQAVVDECLNDRRNYYGF